LRGAVWATQYPKVLHAGCCCPQESMEPAVGRAHFSETARSGAPGVATDLNGLWNGWWVRQLLEKMVSAVGIEPTTY
jgi:hypothetical protein